MQGHLQQPVESARGFVSCLLTGSASVRTSALKLMAEFCDFSIPLHKVDVWGAGRIGFSKVSDLSTKGVHRYVDIHMYVRRFDPIFWENKRKGILKKTSGFNRVA